MIDRSYLPFQSAREHQDRGMAKWMGFFLSEHTTSLIEEKNRVNLESDLTESEKFLLLSQLYVNQLTAIFLYKQSSRKATTVGVVKNISKKNISIKTNTGYFFIDVDDILQIDLSEGVGNE